MARIPNASDALTRFKLTLRPEGDLIEAIESIVRKRSLGAPVIDDEGMVVGVLTEKDCLRIVARRAYRELTGERVVDHMSTLKGVLEPEMDLFAMARTFLDGNFPVLPVLREGRLVGRVGRWGLLRQIKRLQRTLELERRRQSREVQSRQNPSSIESLQRLAASHTREELRSALDNRPDDTSRS